MPRPDESASTKTVRRRQRRFSGKKDKLRPSEHHGHGGRGSGSFLATGVNFGAISWLWHSTIGALSRSIPRVDFGGKVGREGAGRWADDGTGVLSSTEEAAVFALMLGVAVTASLFICRYDFTKDYYILVLKTLSYPNKRQFMRGSFTRTVVLLSCNVLHGKGGSQAF